MNVAIKTQEKQSLDLLKIIRENWSLLVAIISIVFWFSTTGSRLSLVESNLQELEKDSSERNASLVEIQGSVIRIETTLEFIKESLDENKR